MTRNASPLWRAARVWIQCVWFRPQAGWLYFDHLSRRRAVIVYIRPPYVPPQAHNRVGSKSYAGICIEFWLSKRELSRPVVRLGVRTRRHGEPAERKPKQGKKECRGKKRIKSTLFRSSATRTHQVMQIYLLTTALCLFRTKLHRLVTTHTQSARARTHTHGVCIYTCAYMYTFKVYIWKNAYIPFNLFARTSCVSIGTWLFHFTSVLRDGREAAHIARTMKSIRKSCTVDGEKRDLDGLKITPKLTSVNTP